VWHANGSVDGNGVIVDDDDEEELRLKSYFIFVFVLGETTVSWYILLWNTTYIIDRYIGTQKKKGICR